MAVQFLEPMDHVLVVFYTPPLRCIQKQYTLSVWRECEEDAPPWEWRSQYPQLYNLALLSRPAFYLISDFIFIENPAHIIILRNVTMLDLSNWQQ